MTKIQLKRVYSDPEGTTANDGYRIYIDRLWPRGESKNTFHYDLWAKDIAPSTELREWFHQNQQQNWETFVKKYTDELDESPAFQQLVKTIKQYPSVTLLYSSHNTAHNNAIVIADLLKKQPGINVI